MGDFTVQLSDTLVDHLLDDDEKLKKRTRKPKSKMPKDPQRLQNKGKQKQISNESDLHRGTAASGWPLHPPMFLPVTTPTQIASAELEAIRSVLKESESVLQKLQKQEEVIVQEVTQRAKDLHEKEFKLPYQKPMPCLAENNACLDCYKEHAKDPLKCAHLVRNFADCARRARQQVSTAHQ